MKDRTHYGLLDQEVVLDVTPEMAAGWLNARPPAPIMWSRGAANNEKARKYADAMEAGEWDVDRPVEPIAIWTNHGCILGGHHRLTAVTMTGKTQRLRIRFYTKPSGYDLEYRQRMQAEELARFNAVPRCPVCSWTGGDIEAHVRSAHKVAA
jgi:hypothetical protein